MSIRVIRVLDYFLSILYVYILYILKSKSKHGDGRYFVKKKMKKEEHKKFYCV